MELVLISSLMPLELELELELLLNSLVKSTNTNEIKFLLTFRVVWELP